MVKRNRDGLEVRKSIKRPLHQSGHNQDKVQELNSGDSGNGERQGGRTVSIQGLFEFREKEKKGDMVASLQHEPSPQSSLPPGTHALVSPSHIRADLCDQQDMVEVTAYDFQAQVIKDNAASTCPLGLPTLWEASHHVVRSLKSPAWRSTWV